MPTLQKIPPELRQQIWRLALPEPEPEVCIVWPLVGCLADAVAELVVDTAFPVLMHVCRESRAFVLDPSSGITFHQSSQAGCPVPYRPFNGAIDTIYISEKNFEMTIWCLGVPAPDPDPCEPGLGYKALGELRYLAVDWVLARRAGYWLPKLLLRASQNLERMFIVYPSSRKGIWQPFQAPARRCRLRRIEDPDIIAGSGETCSGGPPRETLSMQYDLDLAHDATKYHLVYAWQSEVEDRGGQVDWFTGSAYEHNLERLNVDFAVAAFIQYRRAEDGRESWEEAYEDRLFVYRISPPGGYSSEEALALGLIGPYRPKPKRNAKEWRVNDDDNYDGIAKHGLSRAPQQD